MREKTIRFRRAKRSAVRPRPQSVRYQCITRMREKTIRFRRAEPVERQGTAVLHFAHAGEDKWVSAGRARGDGRGRPSDVRQGTAVLLTGEDARPTMAKIRSVAFMRRDRFARCQPRHLPLCRPRSSRSCCDMDWPTQGTCPSMPPSRPRY